MPDTVASACSFLGLDPLQVANEGKLVAFVDPAHSEAVLAAMRSRPEGAGAVIIGRAVEEHPGMVVGRRRSAPPASSNANWVNNFRASADR